MSIDVGLLTIWDKSNKNYEMIHLDIDIYYGKSTNFVFDLQYGEIQKNVIINRTL